MIELDQVAVEMSQRGWVKVEHVPGVVEVEMDLCHEAVRKFHMGKVKFGLVERCGEVKITVAGKNLEIGVFSHRVRQIGCNIRQGPGVPCPRETMIPFPFLDDLTVHHLVRAMSPVMQALADIPVECRCESGRDSSHQRTIVWKLLCPITVGSGEAGIESTNKLFLPPISQQLGSKTARGHPQVDRREKACAETCIPVQLVQHSSFFGRAETAPLEKGIGVGGSGKPLNFADEGS